MLLDALEGDLEALRALRPTLGLEIGSGSGCVITFLSRILKPQLLACVATDVNPHATRATMRTGERNLVSVDPLLTNLFNGISGCERRLFDVILFNPPYVPTEQLCPMAERPCRESVHKCTPPAFLEAAWAGGPDGRHWIDQVMPRVDGMLAPRGFFYMIALSANRPEELMEWARRDWGFNSKVALRRKAGIESLSVLKFWRDHHHPEGGEAP